ncbi:filamentous hemagglutinin N-terminal domain-containing protein [Aquicoccus sp. SCR17]|nr:filamentous hemagglutinin N-terminal domain-containing protein [Carideicomes alvinocaridis]
MVARTTTGSACPAISGSERARRRRRQIIAALISCTAPAALVADPLPTGGSVAAGDVTISQPSGNRMDVTQGSRNAVVNWRSFDIGAGHTVEFHQPSTDSAILNRVTGNTTSAIYGNLKANGQVHLVNPNGIFIGRDGKVSAGGGFVASTLDISDEDFLARRYRYSGTGSSAGVENRGSVEIGRGGYAALMGGKVKNAGTVSVPLGRIGLASGERVTLDLSGDGFLQVALPTGTEIAEGEALIENSGTASAAGGRVEMKAATARSAARHAINLSGVAEASSVAVRGGTIVLGGGAGGTVTVSGRATAQTRSVAALDSSPRPQARPGGEIEITGARIALQGAELSTSGTGGGGLIRVGGDFGGEGDLPRASTLTADSATTLSADATDRGDGGRIVLWSDSETQMAGSLSARGGDAGGDGGFIEVSSAGRLAYTGLADTRAAAGEWGMLLLDPVDIVVDPGAGGEDDLEANLASGNVTLDTFSSVGSAPGDITINADIDWSAATTLNLRADNDILLNGAINGTNGGFTLDAFGTITPGTAGAVDVASFELRSGTWSQVGADIAAFDAADFIIWSGSTFVRAVGGDGGAGTPYLIGDIFGLQGVGTTSEPQNWALNNDIDASPTLNWSGEFDGPGFSPLYLAGTFDGGLHTISGLYMNRPDNGETAPTAGLFDLIDSDASVSRLFLTGADITGARGGVLAATNQGTISAVSVDGTLAVSEGGSGGLVGVNGGDIEDSVADVAVTAALDGIINDTGEYVGGLVGDAGGAIRRSHSEGSVTVTLDGTSGILLGVGGLVGNFFGLEIEDSYSNADVTVSGATSGGVSVYAGGFGGLLDAAVNTSYSTGTVSDSSDATTSEVGGFAGSDGFTETGGDTNFWDTDRSGLATSSSATGLTTAELRDTEGFISLAGSLGWDFADSWAPGETGRDPVNYTTSRVIFVEPDPLTLTYGETVGATATGSVHGGPLVYVFGPDGDTLDTTPVFADPVFAAETVGTTSYTADETDLTSDLGETYDVVAVEGAADITPAPLTVTANDQSKIYGDTLSLGLPDVTVDGLVFSDTVDGATVTSTGTDAAAGVSGSPYSIEVSDATGTGLSNYDITYVFGTLTVDPRDLTITANDQTKTYGDTLVFGTGDVTVDGLVLDDSVDGVTLSSPGAGPEATVSGSPYVITAEGAEGSGLENYNITYVDGGLTVTPRDLVITALDQSKEYGEALSLGLSDVTVAGLVNTDSVDAVTVTSAGTAADADVAGSPYLVVASDAEGTGLSNYDITYVEGALTIDGRDLFITALNRAKTYGDLLSLGLADVEITGLLDGDSVDAVTVSSDGSAATATVGESPYVITASDAEGTGLGNYDITYVDGEMTVFRRDLYLTANDQTKVYGDALTLGLGDVEIDGLVNDDSVDDVAITSGGAGVTAGVSDSPYSIDMGAAEGSGLENYAISYLSGALTVTPAPLTITANDQVKEPGDSFTFDGTEFTVRGLKVEGDSVDSAMLSSDGASAEAPASESPYTIYIDGPEGEGLENYDITLVEGNMYVGSTEPHNPPPPPPPGFVVPNPPDQVNVSLTGLDSSPGTPVASGGGARSVEQAEQTLGLVRTIAGTLEQSASACSGGGGDVSRVLECLSNALGDFADSLDDVSTDLPPGMENVARIVQDARRGVDAARARAESRLASATTDAERQAIRDDALREAQAAVGNAATEIRKAITLVRADDPELAQLQRETITTVAAAVDSVNIELSRAVGL